MPTNNAHPHTRTIVPQPKPRHHLDRRSMGRSARLTQSLVRLLACIALSPTQASWCWRCSRSRRRRCGWTRANLAARVKGRRLANLLRTAPLTLVCWPMLGNVLTRRILGNDTCATSRTQFAANKPRANKPANRPRRVEITPVQSASCLQAYSTPATVSVSAEHPVPW